MRSFCMPCELYVIYTNYIENDNRELLVYLKIFVLKQWRINLFWDNKMLVFGQIQSLMIFVSRASC